MGGTRPPLFQERRKKIIDMNDIQAVNEVKTLILESVNSWKNYKYKCTGCRQGAVKGPVRPEAHTTKNVYSQLSGLEHAAFNDFIKDDCIPEGDGQVV